MHLFRSARRLAPKLAAALGIAALSASCSTSNIPLIGGPGDTAESTTATTDQRRLELASKAVVADGGEITKVKYYHLDTYRTVNAADRAITFEQRHHLHGAVTLEERLDRFGHYYTIFWKADDRATPVTVIFEYRQKNSGLASLTKTTTIENIKRSNKTSLKVTGEEYWERGSVTAWRTTLVQGGKTIAADQSFLWE
ncbi:MAG: hypothetical protein P8J87_10855 [Verrucomicrobiales bacterium]|nr:hypothetical protein [Verrucomicrobiales bacterium]